MPQQIQVPGYGLVEFPDGMSDDQITAAIQKNMSNNGQQKIAPAQQSGFFNTLANNPVTNSVLGIGDAVRNTLADALNLVPGVNIKPVQSASGTAYNIANFVGNILPFAVGGGALNAVRGAAEGLPALGAVARALGGNGISGVARRAIGTAGYGALTNPNDRTTGAVEGALLSPLADAGGALLNKTVISPISNLLSNTTLPNKILNYARNAFKQGQALSPEQAAENIQKNYLDANGNLLPVDLGTVINNGKLSTQFNELQHVPFSNAAQKANQVIRGQATNQVNQAQQDLQQALINKNQAAQDFANTQKSLNPELQTQTLNQLNEELGKTQQQINNPIQFGPEVSAPEEHAQLSDLQNQLDSVNDYVNKAPDFLNSLGQQANDIKQINPETKQALKKVYSDNWEQSKALYQPINDSKLDLNKLGGKNAFSGYNAALKPLLSQQENLVDLFDSTTDLGSSLNSEIDKGYSFLKGNPDQDIPPGKFYDATLPALNQRIQTLGKLAAAARSNGKRNEGRLLDNLKDGLQSDVTRVLNKSGNKNLANQLQVASNYYKNNLVPFWENNVVRKTVDTDYKPVGDELAQAVHDPNHAYILNQLPDNLKNAQLYQLITKGGGKSSGLSNLTAKQIGANYNNSVLPREYKYAISSYNPAADNYLENIPSMLDKKSQLSSQIKDLKQTVDSKTKDFNSNYMSLLKNKQDSLNAQIKNIENISKGNSKQIVSSSKAADLASKSFDKAQNSLNQAKQNLFNTNQIPPKSIFTNASLENPSLHGAAIAALKHVLMGPIGRKTANVLTNPNLINAYINNGTIRPDIAEQIMRKIAPLPAKAVLANTINQGGQ